MDITLQELADAVGISRSHLAAIEAGRANPTLDVVDRLGAALDTEFELIGRVPILIGGPIERDALHGWCSGYIDRRLRGHGLETAREVGIIDGRTRGWIDLLAFDRRTGTLVIVEIKTSIDDVGQLERQIAWYERLAPDAARGLGWRPTRTATWVLVLATSTNDEAIARQRDVLRQALPTRAGSMVEGLRVASIPAGRGIALIDPRSKRREWLIASRVDGRRSPAPFADLAVARRAFIGPRRSR